MENKDPVSDKIKISVTPVLIELIPGYLKRRHLEIIALKSFLQKRDFAAIAVIGHKLSGNASTYGFKQISEIGADLEKAANCQDTVKIESLTSELANYLDRVEIRPSSEN
jgi:histidine phosphotransfer protein HptB